MVNPSRPAWFEARWPVALTVIGVTSLLALLPDRVRLVPVWGSFVVALVLLAPMVAVGVTRGQARWLRIERAVILVFCVLMTIGTIGNLSTMVHAMLVRSAEFGALRLLASSVAVWVTNVLTFSLLFWQVDRAGPAARASGKSVNPDWLFPQDGSPAGVPPDWRPTFIDYLFLAYSTATAFSTTDSVPVTARAKLLMMVESNISLLTVVVIAARAINILG